MLLSHILLIDTFFAYFSKVRISHIFPHKVALSMAILLLFVFLLPISNTFYYLDQLVTEWHHPRVQTPVEWDGVVGFKQFCTIFPTHIWCLCGPHIIFKCRIELTYLYLSNAASQLSVWVHYKDAIQFISLTIGKKTSLTSTATTKVTAT